MEHIERPELADNEYTAKEPSQVESELATPDATDEQEPLKEGDTKTSNGIIYQLQKSRWNVKQYYSHDGPGWDYRVRLLDDEYTMREYGQTFSHIDVYGDLQELPETPIYKWVDIGDVPESTN